MQDLYTMSDQKLERGFAPLGPVNPRPTISLDLHHLRFPGIRRHLKHNSHFLSEQEMSFLFREG